MRNVNPQHHDPHLEYYILPALIVGLLSLAWCVVAFPVRLLVAMALAVKDTPDM